MSLSGLANVQECMQVQKAERAIVRAVEADKTDVDVDQIVKDLQEKVGHGWPIVAGRETTIQCRLQDHAVRNALRSPLDDSDDLSACSGTVSKTRAAWWSMPVAH